VPKVGTRSDGHAAQRDFGERKAQLVDQAAEFAAIERLCANRPSDGRTRQVGVEVRSRAGKKTHGGFVLEELDHPWAIGQKCVDPRGVEVGAELRLQVRPRRRDRIRDAGPHCRRALRNPQPSA
jgi:hypothetical protein